LAFAAGSRITAARLNRLQPKTYRAVASTLLSGAATNADVPGATVTFDTETANAVYTVTAVWDFRDGATTANMSGNIKVDGVQQSEFAQFRQGPGTASDAATTAQTYRGTLGAAGSHTINMVATLVSGQTLQVYTSMIITIYEVA
jgi:hypothetical protein